MSEGEFDVSLIEGDTSRMAIATATPEHYRAYSPKPLTKAEINDVEILFGGLH